MMEAHRKAGNVVVGDFPRTMLGTNEKISDLIQRGEIASDQRVLIIHSGGLQGKLQK
mgnify:CR=1 FL=1